MVLPTVLSGEETQRKEKIRRRKKEKNRSVKPLTVLEIERLMANKAYFAGIFDINILPNIFISSYPVSLIIYCDQHWVSIYFGKRVEIFDSLGGILDPKYVKLHSFIDNHANGRSIYMIPQIQSDTTNLCSYFSVYFLIMKSKQISFNKLLRQFSPNYAKNEQYVYNFITNL